METVEKEIDTILALSWRDIKSPKMGGAEIYSHEVFKRLVRKGIRVVHIAPKYDSLDDVEVIDGIRYLRKGNMLSVIAYAMNYYKRNKENIDFVIDQCNTHRFFTPFYIPKKKRVFFIHQLTREIWDINMKFPLSYIGKSLETPMLKLYKNDYTITVSESTKQDLLDVGFKKENVVIATEGLPDELIGKELENDYVKDDAFIYVGRYASYKGIDIVVTAFGIVRKEYTKLKLWIVGKPDYDYVETVLKPICNLYGMAIGEDETCDVVIWGFVSDEMKYKLQRRAKALVFPSIREGWGLIISEAAVLGTPSITYDAPGTRDAVDHGKAGYMTNFNGIDGIVDCMRDLLDNQLKYEKIRKEAWDYSHKLDFNVTAELFYDALKHWLVE